VAVTAVLTTGAAAVCWARHRYLVVTVRGFAMAPTFVPGDRVVVRRCGMAAMRTGRVVVVARPDPDLGWMAAPAGQGWVINRVTAVPGEPVPPVVRDAPGVGGRTAVPVSALVVLGDNPASVDSKQHGFCPARALLGVVVRRAHPRTS
jgi:hypothetical protein